MRIFLVSMGIILAVLSGQAFAASITCMSANNAFTRCDLPGADGLHVKLFAEKAGNCSAKGAWGTDSQGVWVNKGCGAVFLYNGPSQSEQTYDDNGNVLIAPVIVDDPANYLYDPTGDYYYNHYNGGCVGDNGGCEHYNNTNNQHQSGEHNSNTSREYESSGHGFQDNFSRGGFGGFSGGGHGGGGGRR